MQFQLCYVTISVKNLERARGFYEGICDLKPTHYYPDGKWQAYDVEDSSGGFAISEDTHWNPPSTVSLVEFYLDDLDAFWYKISTKVKVIEGLHNTSWGTYKFIIEDLDQNRLAFVQR